MTNVSTVLLDFMMNLFKDQGAAAAFQEDPDRSLSAAGLGNVCSSDVDAVMPSLVDFSDVSFDRDYDTGGNDSAIKDNDPENDFDLGGWGGGGWGGGGWGGGNGGWDGGNGGRWDGGGSGGGGGGGGGGGAGGSSGGGGGGGGGGAGGSGGSGGGDYGHARDQITKIVNEYHYSSKVDDRDTITDQSVNQNIWSNGDVTQHFDNESVTTSGDDSASSSGAGSAAVSGSSKADVRTDSSTEVHSSGSNNNVNAGTSRTRVEDNKVDVEVEHYEPEYTDIDDSVVVQDNDIDTDVDLPDADGADAT